MQGTIEKASVRKEDNYDSKGEREKKKCDTENKDYRALTKNKTKKTEKD